MVCSLQVKDQNGDRSWEEKRGCVGAKMCRCAGHMKDLLDGAKAGDPFGFNAGLTDPENSSRGVPGTGRICLMEQGWRSVWLQRRADRSCEFLSRRANQFDM